MKTQLLLTLDDIVGPENLLAAWKEFLRSKQRRPDVQEFSFRLMDNIFALHDDLAKHTYRHGPYQAFQINDPKPRSIHKASVRDRLLHRAIHRILYPFFDRTFIPDSYSCRIGKGMHRAMNRFREFGWIASKNNTRTCWVLKGDIREFFASVDQNILLNILRQYIPDVGILRLMAEVIGSFSSAAPGKGLPLGNITSQLFANVYMNELDCFAKHKLKAEYYIRYADDFVIMSERREWLANLIPQIADFLQTGLKLELHPDKVFIKTLSSGVDFLGWTHFPDHRVLRRTTKKRMMKRLRENKSPATLVSYLGLLKHGHTYRVQKEAIEQHYLSVA